MSPDDSPWYVFNAIVHVRPANVRRDAVRRLHDRPVTPLALSARQLELPFPLSFEDVSAALQTRSQLLIEPDGSFVWSGKHGKTWQIDGNLVDRQGKLFYMTIKGHSPREPFDQLLQCLGWPETNVMFQLLHEALVLDEVEFRRWSRVD